MSEPEQRESSSREIVPKILSFLRQYYLAVIFFTLGIILLFAALISFYFDRTNNQSITFEHSATKSAFAKQNTIKVDVEGAVSSPGVYELNSNDRVEDALRKAKGITNSADKNWIIKNLNLAAKLFDGAKIYVPFVGEKNSLSPNSLNTQNSLINVPSSININTASQSDLESLSGIGPSIAQRIIEGRPYEKIEDLLYKKIVNKSVFDKIKEKISVY
ncbi:ComEA family DNA-binding protein [Candidatus Gottesmanbacteria bacterium]|nr:ComEA family DNA-binding protein [Candidatus Gottesmanbacteria bacterium]